MNNEQFRNQLCQLTNRYHAEYAVLTKTDLWRIYQDKDIRHAVIDWLEDNGAIAVSMSRPVKQGRPTTTYEIDLTIVREYLAHDPNADHGNSSLLILDTGLDEWLVIIGTNCKQASIDDVQCASPFEVRLVRDYECDNVDVALTLIAEANPEWRRKGNSIWFPRRDTIDGMIACRKIENACL